MEIIEEQKVWFEEQKRLEQARGSTGGKSKLVVYKGRRPVVRQTTVDQTRRASTDSTSISETELAEAQDSVPEIVVMHTRDSSKDTVDTATSTGTSGRKVSLQGHKRQSRRFSGFDEFRRKARMGFFGMGGPSTQSRPERQKRWKAGSMALSNFGSKEGK